MLHTRRRGGEGRGRAEAQHGGAAEDTLMFPGLILWFGRGGGGIVMSSTQFDPQL